MNKLLKSKLGRSTLTDPTFLIVMGIILYVLFSPFHDFVNKTLGINPPSSQIGAISPEAQTTITTIYPISPEQAGSYTEYTDIVIYSHNNSTNISAISLDQSTIVVGNLDDTSDLTKLSI